MIRPAEKQRLETFLGRRVFSCKRPTSGKTHGCPVCQRTTKTQASLASRSIISASVTFIEPPTRWRPHVFQNSYMFTAQFCSHPPRSAKQTNTTSKPRKLCAFTSKFQVKTGCKSVTPSTLQELHNHRPTTGLIEPDVSGFIVTRSKMAGKLI